MSGAPAAPALNQPRTVLPMAWAGRLRRGFLLGTMALWGIFAWACSAVLPAALGASMYLVVRGMGVVQYRVVIIDLPSADIFYLFVGAGAMVLGVHALILRPSGYRGAAAVASFLGLGLGLAGYAYLDPGYSFIAVVSFAAIVVLDSMAAAERWGLGKGALAAGGASVWLSILAAGAVAGALRWVVAGFDGVVFLSGPSWGFSLAALGFVGALYQYLPYVTLFFFGSWALRLILPSRLKAGFWGDGLSRPGRLWPMVLLGGGLALAVFVGVSPYLPAVNPSSSLVGVDTATQYSCWIRALPTSVCGFQGFTIENQRLGALWLLEGIAWLTSPGFALRAAPAIWGVLLVLSTYFLVKEGTDDSFLAGLAGLLTAVSTQVVAGLNAGLLANWLGLSLAYFFFAALLRALKKSSRLYLAAAFGLSVALLFVHPWTWVLVLSVLVTYLVADLAEAGFAHRLREKRFEALGLGSILALGFAVDAVRAFFPFGSGLVAAVLTILPYIHPGNALQVVANLRLSFIVFLGSAQADPIPFVLGAFGVLAIPTLKGAFGKLLASWVFVVGFAVVLVGTPLDLMQSRLLYDVPMQVYAAVGLLGLAGVLGRRLPQEARGLVTALSIVAATALLLGFALEYVGFLFS